MIYFRRREFYGPDRYTEPKWHILRGDDLREYAEAFALCGYRQNHFRGRLLVARTTHRKPAATVCAKCAAKLDIATPAS